MLVKDWMSAPVTTVDADASIGQALDLMARHHVTLLPVISGGKLVGTVSDFDLKPFATNGGSIPGGLAASLLQARIKVADVMSTAPVTVPADYTVEEAADILLQNDVRGLVVMGRENRVVGIITQTDIIRVLVSVTGLRRGGIVFGMLLQDNPGSIKELTDILRSHGGRLASILTSYEGTPKGYRKVHIRVRSLDRAQLAGIKEALKERAGLQYLVDFRENVRETYEN